MQVIKINLMHYYSGNLSRGLTVLLYIMIRKLRQAWVENVSLGPHLSLESRTRTVCSMLATSTHSPDTEAALFRQRRSATRFSSVIEPLSEYPDGRACTH